ncbi:MAG TPA: LamG-like jellyroll fold domain-containing protein [Sedimentisphaerales bacterium]|nr:LamG-like jellyroll fold domain-containing protein [Sedimentisphaerales bacterium]
MNARALLQICIVFLLGLSFSGVAAAADPSHVAWWKLDETSGTRAEDSSGFGNHGTLLGDVAWVAGRLGGAWQADGNGDHIEVPDNPSLNISDAVTVSAWVYASASGSRELIEKGGTGGQAWGNAYSIRMSNLIVQFHGHASDPPLGLSSKNTIPQNEWVHIAATFDLRAEGNNQKIYINGIMDAENRNELPLTVVASPLLIGADAYGTRRYWWSGGIDDIHIFNRALAEAEIRRVMTEGMLTPPTSASNPTPTDEAADVPRDVILGWAASESAATHDVYLGTIFDDVNNAGRINPRGVLASQGQVATTYDPPGRLDFSQTYYWRIDEVNAPPTSTIFKGGVWSFTVEPVAYPIDASSISVTASSSNSAGEGPENTINGSGLDADDRHSAIGTDMWLSGITGPQPTWIQYEFDKIYKLHQVVVWNHNTLTEPVIGFGVKEATIEYSVDGAAWVTLGTTHELARGSGAAGYAANTIVDLGGATAKYVKITANSNWGGLVSQSGLSELRWLATPVVVREMSPDDGAASVNPVTAVLTWRAGREAAAHDVYLSTDEQAVIDGTAPAVRVPEAMYAPALELASTYYWKVSEVNEAEVPPVWEGPVQSFSTAAYVSVDDMESYKSEDGKWIWETWKDGFEIASNGALLGHGGNDMETDIIYDGSQSLPYSYGQGGAAVSEATLPINARDWSRYGIRSLSLCFHGKAENTPGQLYMKINGGSKKVYPGVASDLQAAQWQPWTVDLAGVTVVNSLTIGVDGGSGMFFIDAIRLYPQVAEVVTPSQPDTANLLVLYTFDGNFQDSSGKGNHGTPINSPVTAVDPQRGQVLKLDGLSRGLGVPNAGLSQTATVCMWANPAVLDDYDGLFHSDGWAANALHWRFRYNRLNGQVYGGPALNGKTVLQTNQWYHVAFVLTESDTSVWLNGRRDDGAAHPQNLTAPMMMALGGGTVGAWMNNAALSRFLEGMIDDVRIYNRALTQAELLGLTGRTAPVSKGF